MLICSEKRQARKKVGYKCPLMVERMSFVMRAEVSYLFLCSIWIHTLFIFMFVCFGDWHRQRLFIRLGHLIRVLFLICII